MQSMQQFTLWFINNIPTFLLSEPIVYLVGLAILAIIIKVILSILGLSERRYSR